MLKTRVMTAALMVAVLVGLLCYASSLQLIGAFTLVSLMGAWEWARLAQFASRWSRVAYVLALSVGAAVCYVLSTQSGGLLVLLILAALSWLAAALWLLLYADRLGVTAVRWLGAAVLVPAWLGFVALVSRSEPAVALLTWFFCLVAAADIGAYFAGRFLGRHRLAPSISPGKTWEGVAGGTVSGLWVAALGGQWLHIAPSCYLPVGVAVVWVSVIGDLLESRVKRFAGVKDSGVCLPGHGGVLDRLDSITAAVPFFVLGMMLCGRVT